MAGVFDFIGEKYSSIQIRDAALMFNTGDINEEQIRACLGVEDPSDEWTDLVAMNAEANAQPGSAADKIARQDRYWAILVAATELVNDNLEELVLNGVVGAFTADPVNGERITDAGTAFGTIRHQETDFPIAGQTTLWLVNSSGVFSGTVTGADSGATGNVVSQNTPYDEAFWRAALSIAFP